MARRARASSAKPNTCDPKVVNSILDRWEAIQQERLSDLGSYRAKCKEHKASEKDLLEEAKARGVNPKLLKKDIRIRGLKRVIEEINSTVDDDEIADWEAMCAATSERDAAKPTPTEQQKAADSKASADAFDDFTDAP